MAGTNGVIFKPSPAEILAALITVDGAGSGLDADLLDAQSSAAFETAGAAATHAALTAAHGATGAVVGTTNTQTLTNKTLTAPVIADFTNAAHDHQDADDGGQLATAALVDDAITFAKMQNIASDRLIGRDTASTGDPEEISLGASLEWSGSASIQRAALTGDVTASANGNATTIAANAVTDTKLRDSGALSVIGRTANSGGDPADISAAAASGSVFRESGSTVGFGTVATAGIADNAVTLAKFQDVTSDRLLGRDTASSGDPEQLTVGGGVEFTGSGGIQRSALTGDVTATAGSNTTAIAVNAVTLTKIQDIASDRLLGRDTVGSGDPEELTVGGGVEFSGSTGIQRSALTGDVTAPAGSNTTTIAGLDTTLTLKAGTSTGREAKVGGVMFVSTATVGNVTTGEDDLASYSVPANTLATNNDSLWFEACGTVANNANVKLLKARFGTAGTNLIFALTLTPSAAQQWTMRGRIFRTGAATQKSMARLVGNVQLWGNVITALDQTLSGAVTLKVTGEGVATNDIVIESFIVGWDGANT